MKNETKNSQETKEKLEKKAEEAVVETKTETSAKKAPAEKAEKAAKKEAAEKEGKVGLLLKEVRLKQGKTLPEVAQELCIRKVYLEAIEESDYENIPEYPYGIGFIRSYADYLGLDGVNIVQMYKDEAEADIRKKNSYFVIEPQVEATVPSKKYLVVSLVALIAVYCAWNAYNRISSQPEETLIVSEELTDSETGDDENVDFPLKVENYSTASENAVVENEKLPVVEVTKAEENTPHVVVKETNFVEPEAKNVKPAEQPREAKPVKDEKGLMIKVQTETWVEVKNENKLYLSKVLMPGDSYILPNDTNLKLSLGKSDGVEVLLNGKPVYTVSPNKKMNISVDDILAAANH